MLRQHLSIEPRSNIYLISLQGRYNGRDGVSNHRRLDCLPSRLPRRRSKKTSKLRIASICEGNPPVTGQFPSQRAMNEENIAIWRRHHDQDIWMIGPTQPIIWMCLYELDRVLPLRLLYSIILRPRQNGDRFADNIFKCNSLKQNLCILDYISPKVIVNSVIDSDKCLAPNRRQSNAWTNNDPVHWYRHASPGLKGLSHIVFGWTSLHRGSLILKHIRIYGRTTMTMT